MAFLRASAEAFDNGAPAEAKRLATVMRVLLHQTDHSHALLDQLGVLTTMKWFDSAGELDPANLMPSSALLTVKALTSGRDPQYVPPLEKFFPGPTAGRWLSFDPWWTTPVIKDTDGSEFSRRALVLAVANTDGGAHVGGLKQAYARLSRSNSLGWTFSREGQLRPFGTPVLPSIRQICWEVHHSLCAEFPTLMPSA